MRAEESMGCLYTLLGLFLGLQMQQLIKNLRFSKGNAAWGIVYVFCFVVLVVFLA